MNLVQNKPVPNQKGTREIVWLGQQWPSLDHCTVQPISRGWIFNGQLVAVVKSRPFGVNYTITVDKSFKTRTVMIEKIDPDGKKERLRITASQHSWNVNGRSRSDLVGCDDIDLEFSPVTNTLPIRRARPRIGSKIDLTTVWVRFPSLMVQKLRQSYERLGKHDYRYRSGRGFSAKLELDEFGLVNRYGNIWKRAD